MNDVHPATLLKWLSIWHRKKVIIRHLKILQRKIKNKIFFERKLIWHQQQNRRRQYWNEFKFQRTKKQKKTYFENNRAFEQKHYRKFILRGRKHRLFSFLSFSFKKNNKTIYWRWSQSPSACVRRMKVWAK